MESFPHAGRARGARPASGFIAPNLFRRHNSDLLTGRADALREGVCGSRRIHPLEIHSFVVLPYRLPGVIRSSLPADIRRNTLRYCALRELTGIRAERVRPSSRAPSFSSFSRSPFADHVARCRIGFAPCIRCVSNPGLCFFLS